MNEHLAAKLRDAIDTRDKTVHKWPQMRATYSE